MGPNGMRMRGNGDSIDLAYNGGGNPCSTDAGGVDVEWRHYTPGYGGNFGVVPAGINVARHYSEGVFHDCHAVYTPAVGMTTPGRVWMAYVDNPEAVHYITDTLTTDSARLAVLKGIGNVQTGPIWKEMRFRIPPSRRRKAYDVNAAISSSDINQLDRSNQGTLFVAIEGGPASSSGVGTVWYHDSLRLQNLTPILS